MIINSISGQDLKRVMKQFQFNFYQIPGILIDENVNYCIIGEIKKDFYEQIKKEEIKKQFNKYSKIIRFLSTKPNLNKIKKKKNRNK